MRNIRSNSKVFLDVSIPIHEFEFVYSDTSRIKQIRAQIDVSLNIQAHRTTNFISLETRLGDLTDLNLTLKLKLTPILSMNGRSNQSARQLLPSQFEVFLVRLHIESAKSQ